MKTMNETILRKFVDSEGLRILNEWVCYYTKESEEESKNNFITNPPQSAMEKDFLIKLIKVLKKLPISVQTLKNVKIFKSLNEIKNSEAFDNDIRCAA